MSGTEVTTHAGSFAEETLSVVFMDNFSPLPLLFFFFLIFTIAVVLMTLVCFELCENP